MKGNQKLCLMIWKGITEVQADSTDSTDHKLGFLLLSATRIDCNKLQHIHTNDVYVQWLCYTNHISERKSPHRRREDALIVLRQNTGHRGIVLRQKKEPSRSHWEVNPIPSTKVLICCLNLLVEELLSEDHFPIDVISINNFSLHYPLRLGFHESIFPSLWKCRNYKHLRAESPAQWQKQQQSDLTPYRFTARSFIQLAQQNHLTSKIYS